MQSHLAQQLTRHRAETFRFAQIARAEEAVTFVDERGFVYFWPIKDILFPSLWAAVAGDRPVPNNHDDPGHITWRWKDELLDQRKWHYAKVLRGKATMIGLELLPTFYALSENYGEPEEDYRQLYQEGLLSREAKLIYETILREGPLNTVLLRRRTGMTSKKSNSPFERGLTALQRDFKIMPVGVAEAGAWRYSFIYEAVHRYYPELPDAARLIKRSQARTTLARRYFAALGGASAGDVRKLFHWKPRDIARTLARLEEEGFIQRVDVRQKEMLYVLASLL